MQGGQSFKMTSTESPRKKMHKNNINNAIKNPFLGDHFAAFQVSGGTTALHAAVRPMPAALCRPVTFWLHDSGWLKTGRLAAEQVAKLGKLATHGNSRPYIK